MKASILLLGLTVVFLSGCNPVEKVKDAARDAKTKTLFSSLILSMEFYEEEYGSPIDIDNSIELADTLQGDNEKRIIFYDFSGIRNEAGEIIDAHGNPIMVRNYGNRITLYSKGRNGVIDSFPDNDDIVAHYEPKTQPGGGINDEASPSS